MSKARFARFLSVDSAKAEKATKFGYLNGINYMAPHETVDSSGRRFNLCSHASAGCIALCLGKYSGQASMVSDLENGSNSTRLSRAQKAEFFMRERVAFMQEFAFHIARLVAASHRAGLLPCVRPNGATDIAFESMRVVITNDIAKRLNRILKGTGHTVAAGLHSSVMAVFPGVQFVDYTKNPRRFDRQLPANYWLTFSRAESNESDALALLARGVNVAVVFDCNPKKESLPAMWNGFQVIDGDTHDLRHLDPRGERGFVIGLSPKGNKAKKDSSGFIVRDWRAAA